jgi:hypothetical protein
VGAGHARRAPLIEGWLGTDANEVIPNANAYGRLALVR